MDGVPIGRYMALFAIVGGWQVPPRLAVHQRVVVAGETGAERACMIEMNRLPSCDDVAGLALIGGGQMVAVLAGNSRVVVAGEA